MSPPGRSWEFSLSGWSRLVKVEESFFAMNFKPPCDFLDKKKRFFRYDDFFACKC